VVPMQADNNSTLSRHNVTALLFFSLFFPIIFSHVEIPFVFGIFVDYWRYSEKYVLSLPFIRSIFAFNVLFLSPLLFIVGYIFLQIGFRIDKKSIQQNGSLAAFLISFVYALLFTLDINSSFQLNKALLGVLFLLFLSICYLFIKHFFKKNIFLAFTVASLFVSVTYFYHADGLAHFKYAVSLVLLTFMLRRISKTSRHFVYFFLFVFLVIEWLSIVGFSNDSIYIPKKITPSAKPNIILIVADTLRADHFESLQNSTLPSIALLAKDSVVYKNCTSQSSWTLPAHASIFTGLYPTTHGAHLLESSRQLMKTVITQKNVHYPLAQENLTMAEILRSNGYKTYGVVGNFAYAHHSTGISQGFDLYDDRYYRKFSRNTFAEDLLSIPSLEIISGVLNEASGFLECRIQYGTKQYRLAEDINKAVRRIVDKGPFFLFINYNDPHAPYAPVKEYREKFPEIKLKWMRFKEVYGPGRDEVMMKKRKLTKAEKEHLKSAYKAEVMYMDKYIGRLLLFLKKSNIYKNSMIIFTSDHGEFLGEHDLVGHNCSYLYKESISVPLLIKYPGEGKRKTVHKQVQLIGILPTVLKFLGIKQPSNLEGYPLDSPGDAQVISEQYEYALFVKRYGKRFKGISRSILQYPYKYMFNSSRPDEMYNIEKDPQENKNIIEIEKQTAKKLKEDIAKWLNERKPIAGSKKSKVMGKEEKERLKSLGYL